MKLLTRQVRSAVRVELPALYKFGESWYSALGQIALIYTPIL
jgi:hypothetical protein